MQIDTTLPTLVDSEVAPIAPGILAAPFIKSIRNLKEIQRELADTPSPVKRFKQLRARRNNPMHAHNFVTTSIQQLPKSNRESVGLQPNRAFGISPRSESIRELT